LTYKEIIFSTFSNQ